MMIYLLELWILPLEAFTIIWLDILRTLIFCTSCYDLKTENKSLPTELQKQTTKLLY